MKRRCLLATAMFVVLSLNSLYSQRTWHGFRRFADGRDSVDFLDRARHDHHRLEPHQADEDDKMRIPHNLPLPPGANVIQSSVEGPVPYAGAVQPASPVPNNSFTGLGDNNSDIPPDVNAAVGPNYLMETLNSQVSILTKTGTVVSTMSLFSFWPASFSLTEVFDPKILYDPYGQRWILICSANPEATTAAFLVAVSKTTDPTAGWYTYKIAVDPTSNNEWLDYPSIGFSKNWIVLNGNLYGVSDGYFHGTKVWMMDKNNFYAGGTGNYTSVVDSVIGGTLAPCSNYDSTSNTQYLVQSWNGAAGYIALYSVTGPVGSETFASTAFVTTTSTWAFEGPNGWDFAPQLGSTNLIAADDDRMLKAVYRNGHIYCVHNVYLPTAAPTRSSIQWWEINTAGSVLQLGEIDDPTGVRFYAYPSIAVNSSEDVMVGYSSFSALQYASCDYSYRNQCDAVNTMKSDYIYKAGLASYDKTFGGSLNRWGDYSATCVDPTNDNDFWTIQEYAAAASGSTSMWGTWWAQLIPLQTNGGAGTWTWTGGNSTNWFDACNWDKGVLPDINSDVIIPGGTTYNPTITGAIAACNTITVHTSSGAALNINDAGGGGLNINK